MKRGVAPLIAALSLVLAVFTATAVAGNGNGNGNGNANGQANGQANAQAQASTNSTAQASGNAHVNASAHSNANTHATVNAHANVKAQAHAAAKVTAPTPQAPTTQGVKPNSANAATTHNSSAPAASTRTKLYGNGQTAGQIAMQSGVSGSTSLYGPGQSQPHKTTCGSHSVDVHALKSHGSATCATHPKAPTATKGSEKSNSSANDQHVTICHATGSSTNPFVVISPSATGVVEGHVGHQDVEDVVPTFTFNGLTYSQNFSAQTQTMISSGCATKTATAVTPQANASAQTPAAQAQAASTPVTQTPATSTPAAQTPATSTPAAQTPATSTPAAANAGVQGATKNIANKTPVARKSGVQGAVRPARPLTTAAVRSTLPFTGVPLWIALAAAAGLLLAGGAVRLASRPLR